LEAWDRQRDFCGFDGQASVPVALVAARTRRQLHGACKRRHKLFDRGMPTHDDEEAS
jgi:hypothetical protein